MSKMGKIIITLSLILVVLLVGCSKVSKEEQEKSCVECGFERVTDNSDCCMGFFDCITQIECDNNNYIYAFKTSNTNSETNKWGHTKYSSGESYIVTKCEKYSCPITK